jgi:pyruvate dehydrogenase complex dehydrogenase (E1) component
MSKVYKVTASNTQTGRTEVRWAGSMAEVRQHRADLEAAGHKPIAKSAAKTEELEITFNKAGTLEFLNQQATTA